MTTVRCTTRECGGNTHRKSNIFYMYYVSVDSIIDIPLSLFPLFLTVVVLLPPPDPRQRLVRAISLFGGSVLLIRNFGELMNV